MKIDGMVFYTDYPLVTYNEAGEQIRHWDASENDPVRAVKNITNGPFGRYIYCVDVATGMVDDFKMGYLYVDKELTRTPNVKMRAAMQGKNRADKARSCKTTYLIYTGERDEHGWWKHHEFDTLVKAIKWATNKFPKDTEVEISQNRRTTGNGCWMSSCGDNRVWVKNGEIMWRDKWNKWHGRGRANKVWELKQQQQADK